ncbi:DUF4388 domain-containing protein [Deinococcus sonorensis]|uniref:DUF4388 domain-containing protein n=2 Tax=Deinococcus sonorensis TaxID=309891 RepID=A0AAU7U5J5_9DEIO
MPLTGDLADLPFPELTRLLAHHTGNLEVPLSGQDIHLNLFLQQGWLRALFIDGFNIRDERRVRDTVLNLATLPHGSFAFYEGAAEQLRAPLDYRLVDLLEVQDDAVPEGHLPHPATTFTLTDQRDVPAALQASFAAAEPHLRLGTSAELLSALLGLPERDAQLLIYRLRAAGLAIPQHRVAWHTPPAVAAQVAATGVASTPVRRLLGALRRLMVRA